MMISLLEVIGGDVECRIGIKWLDLFQYAWYRWELRLDLLFFVLFLIHAYQRLLLSSHTLLSCYPLHTK